MMHPNCPSLLTLSFILAAASLANRVITSQTAFASPMPINQSLSRVIAVTGLVEWMPEGGTKFNLVSRKASLRQGDLLRLEPGAKITLSCPDGHAKTWTIEGTTGLNQVCPPLRTVIATRGIITPRAGNLDFPYIISPRATDLLTDRPLLRWNAAVGVNSFTVIVRGQGLNWTQEVSRTQSCRGQTCELTYPGSPPLQLGVSYKLVIEADNGRSSTEETIPGLGFNLLNTAKATEVNDIAQRIKAQNLPVLEEVLALADLYSYFNLNAEAIEILETLLKSKKTVEIYRQLGDLYRKIGLALEAEVQYLEAVQLAKASGNRAELAAALAGLGEVNWSLRRKDKALRLLKEAKREYEALGDVQRVSAIEESLVKKTEI